MLSKNLLQVEPLPLKLLSTKKLFDPYFGNFLTRFSVRTLVPIESQVKSVLLPQIQSNTFSKDFFTTPVLQGLILQ